MKIEKEIVMNKGELFQNLYDATIKKDDLFSQVEREGLFDEYMKWVFAGLCIDLDT